MTKKKASSRFLGSLIRFSKPWFLIISLLAGLEILLMGACERAYRFEGNVDDPEPVLEIIDDDFTAKIDPESIPTRQPSDCPGLDSQLYQLIQSENPATSASQIGMNEKNDKIQVLFILESEETGFLRDYDVELGTQSGNQIQAYVPFDRLCELANLDAVLAIRPVDRIFP